MSRLALGGFLALTAITAQAQPVPGRDLLGHGLGLTAEAAALAEGAAAGLWNPATSILERGARGRIGAAALNAPIDLAFAAQVVHLAMLHDRWGTLFGSVAHAAVSDLVRTGTDPQSIGSDIPYRTVLASVGLARRFAPHVIAGAALRWHWGEADERRDNAVVTDLGAVFDGLTRFDGRVAFSTFLAGVGADDSPTFSLATDARVAGADTLRSIRAGVSLSHTSAAISERYPFIEARYARISVRGGPVFAEGYGHADRRFRLGLLLRQDGLVVGLAREDNAGGLSPTYQLAVVRQWR